MAAPYPEIEALNARIFRANLRIGAVLKRAGVGRTTWWRARRGGDLLLSKVNQISDAIDSLIAEKEQEDGGQGRHE